MLRVHAARSVEPVPPASAVLELLKPITWFPPMWAYACGLVSASALHVPGLWLGLLGVALCGPLVCGTSQAVNDWFDRDVDAINEPQRPIPSGRIAGQWGLRIAIGWSLLSAAAALPLGSFGFCAALLGLLLAWLYSAPPVRLKRNGWWGNSAVAVCYEGLPWLTGVTVVTGTLPALPVFVLAGLYSFGAHGIMTLNDFKSVEGDLRSGIGSLPARLGVARAARVACLMMALPQVVVVVLLYAWHRPAHATAVLLSLAVQAVLMRRLVSRPRELAPWYNATGITLYVAGMMVSAFALRTLVSA